MAASGRVNFGTMDAVVFGKPAAEAVAEEARRLSATRVFLMVSSALNRNTDEIARVKAALGNRCSAVWDGMPPHTPRSAVLRATEQARGVGADLIVTIGGGSITDGAKAVQMCLANNIRTADAMDALRPVKGADGTVNPPATMKAPTVRQISVPTTISGGEFSAISGVTDERTKVKELLRHPRIMPRDSDPRPCRHRATRPNGSGFRPVCAPSTIVSRASARARRMPMAMRRRSKACPLLASGLPRVKADPADSRRPPRLPARHMAVDGPARQRRADGREPRHRLRARRRLRRAARAHVVHHAAGRDALERARQR